MPQNEADPSWTAAPRGDVWRSFMERSNIRWIELVSASLVVVCSVGLVISLWSTLSRTSRFFPSLVFMLATLAVHGAGQYTLSRWKLRTTSRGILHIGLMLIPLSVLVGILLAHRQGAQAAFEWNIGSGLAIAVGLLVYGGLAITAARALFGRYFVPIAACTILCSAALVPIDLASTEFQQGSPWIAVTLLPVVLVSMVVSLLLSRQAAARWRWTNAFARRHLGLAVQALFVSITACVFWFLKFKPSMHSDLMVAQGASDWWWLAVGLMGVAWSAWGWSVSLARGSLITKEPSAALRLGMAQQQSVDRDASWFLVMSWILASLATLALAVGVWQANHSRTSMVSLLLIGGLWWLVHGGLNRISLTQLSGSLATMGAFVLIGESSRGDWSLPLQTIDWVSHQRIDWMTFVGWTTAALATGYLYATRATQAHAQLASSISSNIGSTNGASINVGSINVGSINNFDSTKFGSTNQVPVAVGLPRFIRLDQFVGQHWAMAGAGMILSAACLTVIASCVPFGATPWGGQWSAWYLAGYGIALTIAGIGLERTRAMWSSLATARWVVPCILPIGLAISILATVRFGQSSDLMPDWIVALRPTRAWSVGLTALATTWAMIAVVLELFGWPVTRSRAASSKSDDLTIHCIDWLNISAIAIALFSCLGVVRFSDLSLVSNVHWQLPLLSAAIWWTWRSHTYRGLTLLLLGWWSLSTLYVIGEARQWWSTWPSIATLSSHVALASGLCLLAALCVRGLSTHPRVVTSARLNSLWQPKYWALPIGLIGGLIVMLIACSLPAIVNLGSALGMHANPPSNAPRLPLIFAQPNFVQTTGVCGTIILWLAANVLASRLTGIGWLRALLGFAPLLFALVLTAAAPWHHALSVCLAVLALSLITAELMTLISQRWLDQSELSWLLWSEQQRSASPEVYALSIGRALSISLMFGLTALAIVSGWNGQMPAEILPRVYASSTQDFDSWSRLQFVLAWMWPVLSYLSVHWSLTALRDGDSYRMSLTGYLLAIMVACTASLVGMAAIVPWLYGAVAWLQWFVIALSALAGTHVGLTLLRNFMALRIVDRGQSKPLKLLGKAANGGRWKRAVASGHTLLWSGLLAMIVLCVMAAATNSYLPLRFFESVHALSTWPTWLAYGLLALVVAWLWRSQRDTNKGSTTEGASRLEVVSSYAGLVALLLGMAAPLAAVCYAEYLAADSIHYSFTTQRFGAYRAQVLLWLAALAVGLVMRWSTASKKWPLSGEVAWCSLAGLVAFLSLTSSSIESEPLWAVSELGVLALVAVLSSCISGQAWRGHAAAVLAGAACWTWAWGQPFSWMQLDRMTWQTLIGPILVAGVSLAWQLVSQRTLSQRGAVQSPLDAPTIPIHAWVQRMKSVDQTVSRDVPVMVCLLTCLWIFTGSDHSSFSWPLIAGVGGGAWLLACARLWDARRGGRGWALYIAFVAATLTCGVLFGHFNELPMKTRGLLWMASALGSLAVVAGCLREWLRESPRLIPALRLGNLAASHLEFEAARRRLVPWHSLIGLMLLVPCVQLALVLDLRELRLLNAALPLLSGLSILPLAIDRQQLWSRRVGLWLISVPLILWACSDMPALDGTSSIADGWFYLQRAMAACVLLGWMHWFAMHWLNGKLDWPEQLKRSSWIAFGVAAMLGGWMLVGEFVDAWPRVAQSASLGTQCVWLLAWVGLIGRAIQFALVPVGIDQRSSLRSRQAAVYATEAGMSMLALATYLCFPQLFNGLIADWWPLIVYALAMLSAAIGHWATQSRHEVIADPVRRSSLLLPLVPLLGVWLPFSRQLEVNWSAWQSYSLLLFSGAVVYALHGWLQRSIKLNGLAAVLTMLSFWSLLHSQSGLRFFEHPQFWIVPPAVATLIFVEANRSRLDGNAVTATRYMAILLAYLSSTSEIVLKAFEGQMWQPLLLLMLAVVGVLAGIGLRVRAFLFCGATFVMVALLGMVWHAQQAIDQVWPWWAFGILTGVSLIVMLGYFEKNRPQVLGYAERLKSWEL